MEPIVELENIHKRYGPHVAVEDVSLRVMPGEVFGFLGPNGAGKTTSIRILLDIIAPDRGRRRILGADSALDRAARIGYLPEERGLYKNMTAQGVIAYLAQLKGMRPRPAKLRARALLERYGLEDAMHKRIRQMSKGMAQKVQVLSTLAHDPDLLILDEPFSGLDPVNQQVLESLLADMKAAGKTIMFSTHVMQHAERLCDRIGLVARGRDVFTGSLDEARALLPAKIRLRTRDPVDPLAKVDAVRSIDKVAQAGDLSEYEITAERGTAADVLIRATVENHIALTHFTMIEASLHDVFVRLVGEEDARAPAQRAGEAA